MSSTATGSATATVSDTATITDFGITTASGYSDLLPCGTYGLTSALMSQNYYDCPQSEYDAGRFGAYIGCLCDSAHFSVLSAISYGVNAATYSKSSCNDYQVFSANSVYNGYCSGRGFVITTITSGTRVTATVTSLGGPTNVVSASATPTATASSRGLSSTAKIMIEIVAGVVGFIILVSVLWRLILRCRRRHTVHLPPHNNYRFGAGAGAETPSKITSPIPFSPYHPINIQDDRTSQWVHNRNNGGTVEDQRTVTSETLSDPTHDGDYPMNRLRRPAPTFGRF